MRLETDGNGTPKQLRRSASAGLASTWLEKKAPALCLTLADVLGGVLAGVLPCQTPTQGLSL